MLSLRQIVPTLLALVVGAHAMPGHAQQTDTVDSRGLGSYHALVIGIPEYDHFEPLRSAAKDATDLAALLDKEYGYRVSTLKPDATDEDLRAALDKLDRLSRADHLLIYFSGHGEKALSAHSGYWLLKNAEHSDAALGDPNAARKAHWISRAEVIAHIEKTLATQVLVIDDSCFSGNAGASAVASNTSEPGTPQPPASPSSTPAKFHGLEVNAAMQGNNRRARIWISASGANETASAGQSGQTSAFTRYFLNALKLNEVAVDALELFVGIRRQMASAREIQVPEYHPLFEARDGGGDFLFFKTTWSSTEREMNLGRVSVRAFATGTSAKPAAPADFATSAALEKLVWKQMADLDEAHKPVRVNDAARPLLLSVTYIAGDKLVITIVDRSADRVLGKLEPAISRSGEELATVLRASMANLYERAANDLEGTALTVDTVNTALRAQGHQRWDVYLTGGPAAYIDFDGNGLLNHPAVHLRLGADINVLPWLLLGPSLGFDTTRAESSSESFVGDLSNGTYAHNRLLGKTALQTLVGTIRATIRQQHGLVRPLGFFGLGAAYLHVDLTDQHFVPVSGSDTLPINLTNQRSGSSGWAVALEFGGGVSFQVFESFSILTQASFFKPFHHLTFVTELQGVNQAKPVRSDFQSIQTASLEVGGSWHW